MRSLATKPRPQPAPRLELADGTTAEKRDDALEIRDRDGRLLVRFFDGAAEISAPNGDLRLVAPAGRVVISSAQDVVLEAARDIRHRAARSVDVTVGDAPPRLAIDGTSTTVRAARLALDAREATGRVDAAAVVARTLTTTAETILVTASTYERVAEHAVERARSSLRDVADLAEDRAGRVRTLVRGLFSLASGRTTLDSEEETKIDGSRILLG